ncbi:MAG: hypothetical protein ACRDNG_04975 [Gaiellaceae bacterium]
MKIITAAAVLLAAQCWTTALRAQDRSPPANEQVVIALRQWSTVSNADSALLETLVESSIRLRDERVLDAMLRVAAQTGLPEVVRLSAMRVLLTYLVENPQATVGLDALRDPVGSLAGRLTHRSVIAGPQPITPTSLQRARAALEAMAASDPNENVRNAADFLAREYKFAHAEPPQLAYLCGNRFSVRNTNDFAMSVVYDVEGTVERGELLLAPRSATAPYSQAAFETERRGTVRLLAITGDMLATAANGNEACTP